MDYYKVLGLSRTATKPEIKEAFRNLAVQFHPDKHSGSPNSVRDRATFRFKQASEAYRVLVDDRKRADYDLRYTSSGTSSSGRAYEKGPYGYGYGYGYHNDSRRSNSYSYARTNGEGFASRFEVALRFLTSRSFLLQSAFAGVFIGGVVILDTSRDKIWRRHNSGKSFEEAMESIQKTKAVKEKA